MSKAADEKQRHLEWLQQADLRELLRSSDISSPWFPAYKHSDKEGQRTRFYSALVPVSLIPKLIKSDGWDIGPAEGVPSIWTHYHNGDKSHHYCPFGNEDGIEPIVIYRSFHDLKPYFLELSQELRFYFNLYPDATRNRFIQIDSNGDEADAVRYDNKSMEIRTDLIKKFCAVKQMALAIYVESFRYSRATLSDLGLTETRTEEIGEHYRIPLAIVPDDFAFEKKYETCSVVIGAKKYILPGPEPFDKEEDEEQFQEFIIGSDSSNKPTRYTCNPDKLANYFGANPGAPNFLTPVFFRAEVLSKYYADPAKYSVEDGYLRCGSLWGLRMDNDHADYVVVYLGDLGESLSEAERHYWLSFNIAPDGRGISKTNFKRSFMAEPAEPKRPDLVFKYAYTRFTSAFYKTNGWEFFLPLHADDEHFFSGLRLLSKDNQAEFDLQLLALTKVMVDSLNEKMIAKGLTTLAPDDKGITKLEKYFSENGHEDFESHISFLRVLQDLRSKSAAHRKGNSYNKLITELQMSDDGQQTVFASLLISATEALGYLHKNLITVLPTHDS